MWASSAVRSEYRIYFIMDRLSSTTYMGIGIVDMVIIDMFKVVFFHFPYMNSRVYPCISLRREDKETRGTFQVNFKTRRRGGPSQK